MGSATGPNSTNAVYVRDRLPCRCRLDMAQGAAVAAVVVFVALVLVLAFLRSVVSVHVGDSVNFHIQGG